MVAMYELLVSEGAEVVWIWSGFGLVYTMLGLDAISSTGDFYYLSCCLSLSYAPSYLFLRVLYRLR